MARTDTQARRNPFPYSDTNKRYYTFDYYLRKTYGGKCVKLPLDAGFTCPNLDGRCGKGGCIYCSGRGSGDFALESSVPLREQYERQRRILSQKWETLRCIPYLQAHTNTYGDAATLRRVYMEILSFPDVVSFHIATRADCLPPEVLSLLREISEIKPLTLELGLQTAFDDTARKIHRGHTLSQFYEGFFHIREAVPKARIAVHLINGLPGETADMMLESAACLSRIHPDEVKIHLLLVLKDAALYAQYKEGQYVPMARDAYIATVIRQLEILPPDVVIGRLTGDGSPDNLVAPLWSRRKTAVLNDIDKALYAADSWQGKKYKK